MHRRACPAHLVVGKRLLGDAQLVGERLLAQATLLAQSGDARPQRLEELLLVGSHRSYQSIGLQGYKHTVGPRVVS